MNGNGHGFMGWIFGVMGTLITGVTLFMTKKVLSHDTAIAEWKAQQRSNEANFGLVRDDIKEVKLNVLAIHGALDEFMGKRKRGRV